MAENVLGLLFVAASSHDRYVFRYPPDPGSHVERLTQPVYPRNTYTAHDNNADNSHNRLFPRRRRVEGASSSGRAMNKLFGSNPSSARKSRNSLAGPGTSGFTGRRVSSSPDSDSLAAQSLGGSVHSHFTEYGTPPDSESSSSSEGSDYDGMLERSGGTGGQRHWHRAPLSSSEPRGASVPHSYGADNRHGLGLTPRVLTELGSYVSASNLGRRGSLASDGTTKPDDKKDGKNGDSKHGDGKHSAEQSRQTSRKIPKAETFIEGQYNYSMGYKLDFLGDMLTPPRAACNRKFEVSVDELVFVGHPVCNNKDGKWAYPTADDDDSDVEDGDRGSGNATRRVPRGRRMNDRTAPPTASHTPGPKDLAGLRTLSEHPGEGGTGAHTPISPVKLRTERSLADRLAERLEGRNSESATEVSSGTDTPASRGPGRKEDEAPVLNMFHLVLVLDKPDPKQDVGTMDAFNQAYREIAFKWTAAAFALQVRENWVAKQAKQIAAIRERCIAEGVPVMECVREVVEKTELARSIHELFAAIHKLKGPTFNTHFRHVSTTLALTVGSIPINIVIPPRSTPEEAAIYQQHGDMDLSSDDDSDEGYGISVVGRDGVPGRYPALRVEPWQTLLMLDEGDRDYERALVERRRGSKSQHEEDDLVSKLIAACDVSKPLHELAHTLRFDLENIIIPLARELVQNKRAILVDPITIRLRTILLPANVSAHVRTITKHSVRFAVAFPKLGPLIPFLAMISSAPVPFRDLLPPDVQADTSKRDPYIRAIEWLLRNDLVEQAHVRARVVASPAVKEAAWRRLWHRRRARWLRQRKHSMTTATSNGSSRSRHGSSTSQVLGDRIGPRPTRPSVTSVMSAPGLPQVGGTPTSQNLQLSTSTETNTSGGGGPSPNSAAGMMQRAAEMMTPRAEGSNPLDGFAARVPRSGGGTAATGGAALGMTRTESAHDSLYFNEGDFDSDLEMDSDVEGGDGLILAPANGDTGDMRGAKEKVEGESASAFSLEVTEPPPESIPKFTASFIFHPARAQKDEARWLRVIRERAPDAVMRSRFDLCVQYMDGVTTFEEMMFRTGLNRREIDRIASVFREDLMLSIHV